MACAKVTSEAIPSAVDVSSRAAAKSGETHPDAAHGLPPCTVEGGGAVLVTDTMPSPLGAHDGPGVQHAQPSSDWQLLPVEILLAVTEKVPISPEAREVCRSWRSLICGCCSELRAHQAPAGFDPGLWLPRYQSLRLLHMSAEGTRGLTDAGLASLASSLPNLMELSLESCRDVSEEGIEYLTKLGSLTRLSFSWCAAMTSEMMQTLCSSLTGLQHLNLEGSEKLTSLEGLSNLHELESLRLQYCCQLEDASLESISSMSSLTRLNLGWCPELTCEGLSQLSSIKSLTEIGLQEMEVSCLAALQPLTAIRSINLDEARVTERAAGGLGALTSLESLSICWCHSFTDWCASGLETLVGLTELKMAWCQQLSARGVQHMAGMAGLRVLNLANCQVTNTCLGTIAGLEGLTDLNLSGAERVTDDGLRSLGEGLRRLKRLSLRGCRLITAAGLACLAPLADYLEDLSLRGCGSIAEGGAESLANLSGLQRLNLKDCDALQAGGLGPLSLLRLHTLDLGRCQWADPSGLAQVLQAPLLASLRVLKLKGCSALTDDSIRRLGGLQCLDVRYCKQLSEEVVQWATVHLGQPCRVRRDVPSIQRLVFRADWAVLGKTRLPALY